MKQSFATHSHLASIRSVDSNKHYLASAAADDTICLYDMRTRTENGKLVHHNDTVNSISFTPDASHLMSVSSDGTIGIVRCGSWQLEKHWLKPHKGLSVDTLAIHPTGKLAMTTGHDGVLRTWNLVKGRQAYATNLVPRWKLDAKNISVLKWSPNGNNYLIAANNKIDIYSVETAGVTGEFSFDDKVASVEYLNDSCIAVGLTDGKIIVYDLESSTQTEEIQAHEARVKCLAMGEELLVSGSSSGEIKLWSFQSCKLTLLNIANCSARISCLTLTSYQDSKNEEDIIIEEEIPEKSSNKLRLKQKVIIEEENDRGENIEVSKRKRKRNKNNSQNKIEDNNNMNMVKKIKTNEPDKLLLKKKRNNTSDLSSENLKKKKKLLDPPKKMKEFSESVNESSEIQVKKKKLKGNPTTTVTKVTNDQSNINKKKRKISAEDAPESSPKKQKAIVGTAGNAKKKKKKNLKNKILM